MHFEEMMRRYLEDPEACERLGQEFAAEGIAEMRRAGVLSPERCLHADIAATRLRDAMEQWRAIPDDRKPTLILALVTPQEVDGLLALYTVGLGTLLGLGDLTNGGDE